MPARVKSPEAESLVLTIGHSTRAIYEFIRMLKKRCGNGCGCAHSARLEASASNYNKI